MKEKDDIHDEAASGVSDASHTVDDASDALDGSGAPDAPEAVGKKRRYRLLGWVNGPSRAIALAVFLVFVVLFGRDALSSWQLEKEISKLRERKRELLENLAADSILLRRLDDAEFLERYAREHYLMRREGETVYIIEE